MKFFIAAINHYGDKSGDVRLKNLNEFAKKNDLIVPTSALKNYCVDDNMVRGHYNLLLTGIEPEEINEVVPDTEFREEEEDEEVVIIDTPAFVEPPMKKRKGNIKPFKPEPGQKEKTWIRPIYVVSDGEGNVRGTHETPKGAFEKRFRVFHDHGLMDYNDFLNRMKYTGAAIIPSGTASSLHCLIEMMEIEQ